VKRSPKANEWMKRLRHRGARNFYPYPSLFHKIGEKERYTLYEEKMKQIEAIFGDTAE